MNIKRAIWISILTYASSLIIGILVALLLDIELTPGQAPTTSMWIIAAIATIILAALFSVWYFKKEPANTKAGFCLGLMMIIVGTVLDIILLTPVVLQEGINSILSYYASPYFFLTLLLLLATTTLTGYILAKRKL